MDLSGMPRVDAVLRAPQVEGLGLRHEVAKAAVAQVLAAARERATAGGELPSLDEAVGQSVALLSQWCEVRPAPVINATGVLLHTNLGRAPLAPRAVEAAIAAAGACDVELDHSTGHRGSRMTPLQGLLTSLTGAEAALVVNNNAAALMLATTALSGPRGVVVSAGQLVEIGDGFRVGTMAGAAGCPVTPVGSTNRTHLRDYVQALEAAPDDPPALLWVHASNFRQVGYVADVELRALAELATRAGTPLIADLGSGRLGGEWLPAGEPTVRDYIDAGVTVALASGDKLLGGPQCGVVVGTADAVATMARHPMARALRCDKVTLASLHATLVEHARAEGCALPLRTMLESSLRELQQRAETILDGVPGWRWVRVDDATVGGGSLPGERLQSIALVASGPAQRLADALRRGAPSVIGRIHDGALRLDLRSVLPEQDMRLREALLQASQER